MSSLDRSRSGSVPRTAESLALIPGAEPVPGYVLVKRLGRGGCGEVWQADGPGGFSVALKFVSLGDEVANVELRSLSLLKEIRHANLLGISGAWQTGGMLVIALEMADGSLLDRLKTASEAGRRGLPAAMLLEYMQDAARGIDHLHERGIQHRDIKPANLLLLGGSVKVADFGLAKLLHRTQATNNGHLTPGYAAPECFRGLTSAHSDQYSLAVSYCQLRCGRLPFRGDAAKIMIGHLHEAPDLTLLPDAERPIVARALSKVPEQRYPSCRSFVRALAAVADMEGASTAPTPPSGEQNALSYHDTKPNKTEPTAERNSQTWPKQRLRLRTIILGALGSLLLLGLLAAEIVWVIQSYPSPAKPSGNAGEARPGDAPRRDEANKGQADSGNTVDGARGGDSKKSQVVPIKPPEKALPQAIAALNAGKLNEAEPLFEEALRQEPSAEAYRERARLWTRRELYSKAEADLTEAIKRAADVAGAYLERAGVRLELHREEDALADCDRAAEHGATDAETRSYRVAALTGRGKLRADKKDWPGAVADYTEALRLAPDAKLRVARGDAYRQLSKFEEAAKDYSEALKAGSSYAASFGRATALRLLGQFEEAGKDYDDAIKADSEAVEAYFGRALARRSQGRQTAALADLDEVLTRQPRFGEAYYHRGLVHHAKRSDDKAEADYTAALSHGFRKPEVYLARAESLRIKTDYFGALKDCTEALRLDENNATALSVRGDVYLQLSQYTKAIEDCSAALKKQHDYVDALATRGAAYYARRDRGDLKEALADLDRALVLNSSHLFAHRTRGDVLFAQEFYQKAAQDYTYVIDHDPSPQAYRDRAAAYDKNNEPDKAKADRERAKALETKSR
jgi:tetratricopeptide (TPR) repeat protein